MSNFRFVMILLILCMAMVPFAVPGVAAAGMGIVAETHVTSGESAPACPAQYDCISETAAIRQWGTNGYEKFGKSVCGQSDDAMVQYYCFRQIGSAVPPATSLPPQTTLIAATPLPTAPPAPAPVATRKSPGEALTPLAAAALAGVAAISLRRL